MNNFGAAFAPTQDNATMGPRNGQISGVPQAVQVLSLALPRVVGSRPVAPNDLLTAQGGHGIDPIASAVLDTILKTMRNLPGSGGNPLAPGSPAGGTAGPNLPGLPGPGPMPHDPRGPMAPPKDPWGGEQAPGPVPFDMKPRIVTQDDPAAPPVAPLGGRRGGWNPGLGPYVPPRRGFQQ